MTDDDKESLLAALGIFALFVIMPVLVWLLLEVAR